VLLGIVHEATDNWGKALENFEKALKLAPNLWSTHLNLATLYKQIGQPEKSTYHRERCIKLHPEAKEMFEKLDNPNDSDPSDDGEDDNENDDEEEQETSDNDESDQPEKRDQPVQ